VNKSQSVTSLIAGWTTRFSEADIETAALDARVLALWVCAIRREDLIADPDTLASREQVQELAGLCTRRLAREPIAHLVGIREFWSLEFEVSKETLVPRPDSETLVQLALSLVEDKTAELNLLDLGTGSGCLLIALLFELNQARGMGIDISAGALAVARRNAQTHGVAARSEFRKGNWGEGLSDRFEIVVCNPPYIPDGDRSKLSQDVASFEPESALFGGADGLDPLRALIGDVKRLLTPKGFYVMEYGAGQTDGVQGILRESGFEILHIARDLAGIDRTIAAKVAKM
jgi:release factor glutamine methyltransferase